MRNLHPGWLGLWLVFFAGGGVLAFGAREGIIAMCFAGFIFFIINAELFRKELKGHGIVRRSYTRNPWYFPLAILLFAALLGVSLLLEVPVSLLGFVLAAAAVQASVYWILKLIGQDVEPYQRTWLLDVLYPLIFMTIPVVDWVDKGAHPLLLMLGPLVFFLLALALLREYSLMLPNKKQTAIKPTTNVI